MNLSQITIKLRRWMKYIFKNLLLQGSHGPRHGRIGDPTQSHFVCHGTVKLFNQKRQETNLNSAELLEGVSGLEYIDNATFLTYLFLTMKVPGDCWMVLTKNWKVMMKLTWRS